MASSSSAGRIDPQLVISHKFPEGTFSYSERDVAIYALGIGACAGDAVDEKELKYVYHQDGQRYIEVKNKVTVAGLHDKGKAAIIEIETTSYIEESGEALCMNRSTIYLRGAGGFSKSSKPYSYANYPAGQVSSVLVPKHKPSMIYEDQTQQFQALLYRLSGAYNRLHSDPMVARIAGSIHQKEDSEIGAIKRSL